MSYYAAAGVGAAPRGRQGHGLMGLGATIDDQAPIRLGTAAERDPILSTASVIASGIMLKMAAVPQHRRAAEMVAILDRAGRGLGESARRNYLARAAAAAPDQKDQAMFDAIRATVADLLAAKTLAKAGLSGLGQTIAEVQGRTSTGVNDANALFCSYGAGTASMVSGLLTQFGTSGSTGGLVGAQQGGQIAGCGAGQLVIQGQQALAQARLSQSATQQALAAQAESDARFMRYGLMGLGLLGLLGIGYVVAKK